MVEQPFFRFVFVFHMFCCVENVCCVGKEAVFVVNIIASRTENDIKRRGKFHV